MTHVATASPSDAQGRPGAPEPVREVAPTFANLQEVQNLERARIGNEPQVGLAISGGGIRSATFALGLLQALTGLGLFTQIDYVSTVSGGGYTGGWLYALLCRGQLSAALHQNGTEPRQVRFLRAYSNYLTPKLGLFSGDTWAAFATVVRNLAITFSILSLSLIAVLYLPWSIYRAFHAWQVLDLTSAGAGGLLGVAVWLLAVAFATSASNMSRALADGTWENDARDWTPRLYVQLLVVIPILVAMAILAAFITVLPAAPDDLTVAWVVVAGAPYAVIWSVSLLVAHLAKAASAWRRRDTSTAGGTTDWIAAAWGWLQLTALAIPAGAVGMWVVTAVDARWIAPLHGVEELRMPLMALGILIAVTAHIGLTGRIMSDETREWWSRVGGQVILGTLLLSVLVFIAIHAPRIVAGLSDQFGTPTWTARALGAAWAAITGSGILAGQSARTADGRGTPWMELAGRVAPFVFVVGYLVIVAVLLLRVHEPSSATSALGWMTVFAVASWALSWLADLNEFSMHALYRNRLVRCYLGATNADRKAHPFHGFDSRDDLPLHPEPDATSPLTPIRPYPLFNAAINLVGGKNLAWQQRKAASFVFSPDACGYEYRVDEERDRGLVGAAAAETPTTPCLTAFSRTERHGGGRLSVGLAMATSGAAASPNMGYHTSPTLSFLMTVFNVRLGWWLRNPRSEKSWTWRRKRLSILELIRELLGLTTDDRDFVYLSDGGHFENLGVYELVRRRCPFVIVSDAGQDGALTFEDLGNAIEKCRADFGIPIEIDVNGLRPGGGRSTTHCAVGTIHYECADHDAAPGTIVYLKSSLTGDEPSDVLRYASLHPEFPHQSTADQFFSESQFESYRELGHHVGMRVFAVAQPGTGKTITPSEMFRLLRQRWTPPAPLPHDGIAKYSNALNTIWATVRSNDALRFLDQQVFPEWASLMAAGGGVGRGVRLPLAPPSPTGQAAASGASPYWLPASEDDRRAGFYVCNQMLQLMEDVYIEFRLDDHYGHIDNRGWMNLFQHWAWSGMLSATWAVTAATYDPRFQRFCAERLDLGTGRVVVPADTFVVLPSGAMWKVDEATRTRTVAALEAVGLNFWEVQLVAHYISDWEGTRAVVPVLLPIRVRIESPRRQDGGRFEFTAGYMILDCVLGQQPVRLFHMRVQNHLRKMGVATAALRSLLDEPADGGEQWGVDQVDVEVPQFVPKPTSVTLAEAYPTAIAARQIEGWILAFRRG